MEPGHAAHWGTSEAVADSAGRRNGCRRGPVPSRPAFPRRWRERVGGAGADREPRRRAGKGRSARGAGEALTDTEADTDTDTEARTDGRTWGRADGDPRRRSDGDPR